MDYRMAPADPDSEQARATARMARAVFDAAAASVLRLDERTFELVFEAVAGAGEDFLVGTRFPADHGIAGWTLASGEPIAVDDLADNPVFARDVAESTGYVPKSLMAVPLLNGKEVAGVLEVLDAKPRTGWGGMADLDLLATIGEQAGPALQGLFRDRAAADCAPAVGDRDGDSGGDGARAARAEDLVRLIAAGGPRRTAAGQRLLEALYEVLSESTFFIPPDTEGRPS